jgi:DNA polymerase III subunit epsilon
VPDIPSWFNLRRKRIVVYPFPPDTPLGQVRFVVFDTEFTSLDQRSNRLLSVGAMVMEGAKIRMGEQFYRVLNPGVEVPPQTVVVHKLRPHDVEQGESPLGALTDLHAFIAGSVLVGHFVQLDLDILQKELRDTEHVIENPAICTAHVHRWLLRRDRYSEDLFHRLENVSLATLAQHYQVEFREAHHALEDAFVTARLWQKLLSEVEKHGIRTLRDLLKISHP